MSCEKIYLFSIEIGFWTRHLKRSGINNFFFCVCFTSHCDAGSSCIAINVELRFVLFE